MMTPQTMHFFRDELEKQAIFTPSSASWAMKYAKPGMFGNAVRTAGRFGANVLNFAAKPGVREATKRIGDSAMYGPGVLAGSIKGELANLAMKRMKAPVGARRALTGESIGSPLETTFNPIDVGNLLPSF